VLPTEANNNYAITTELIRRDLTAERPQWILSCYGPGKDAPEQLFGGPLRELSPEEMRLHYLNGAKAGNERGAVSRGQTMQVIWTPLLTVSTAHGD
jgi:nucleoporin NUP42